MRPFVGLAITALFGLVCIPTTNAKPSEDESEFPNIEVPLLRADSIFRLSAPGWVGRLEEHHLDRHRRSAQPGTNFSIASQGSLTEAWGTQYPDGIEISLLLNGAVPKLVRLAIASQSALHLPEIGWLQRWAGPVAYSDAAGCERIPLYSRHTVTECMHWYGQQLAYRRALYAEFIRDFWLVAGQRAEEGLSHTPHLPVRAAELPGLSVQSLAQDRSIAHLRIPWAALPPSDHLELRRVYVHIEICRGLAEAFAPSTCEQWVGDEATAAASPAKSGEVPSAGPTRWPRRPEPFVAVELDVPRVYRVGACMLPLQGDWSAGFGWHKPAYFLPSKELELREVFALYEPTGPYRDAPEGWSPTVVRSRFGQIELGAGEYLCFPKLTWVRGAVQLQVAHDWLEPAEPSTDGRYRSLPIDKGNYLVIAGPYEIGSRSGQGMCGACPRAALGIWYLDRQLPSLTNALQLEDIVNGFEDGANIEIEVADDGRKVRWEYTRCDYQFEGADTESGVGDEVERCSRDRVEYCLSEGEHEFKECLREKQQLPGNALTQGSK